ncbi:Calcium/calmodulin-dependent protein kinase type 1 [Cytospora mali]|uniref:Autophagy-related protein 1 n=1 Tax=Cytospora mali TaxID=578113 RepID=A0A194V5I1_CYTMA|nr:Calcium/calmodulin-dependent protein kinase type 1 [Valsa mali var. pyri (nom. inval.)]
MQPEISVDERVEERRLITEILPDGSRHYLSNAGGDVEEEWRKTKPLGQGTFGDVWQEQCVSDPKDASGRLRAIKKISKGHLHIMKRELKALATFSDPASPDYADYRRCFVEFFGWFENEDHIYIATEFVPHLTLHDHITNRPISEPEAASITVQIARALRFMHQAKFVHRDIKPLNILVASPGPLWRVKVADFGIAKNTQGTQLKTLSVGTVMYMAPELIQATNVESKPYTAAVDIWSLGAIAFCACTGRPPFASQYETYDFTRGLIEFPKGALSNCSQALTDFVMATMAISPAERPTADEILSHSWVRPYVTYVDRLFGT